MSTDGDLYYIPFKKRLCDCIACAAIITIVMVVVIGMLLS